MITELLMEPDKTGSIPCIHSVGIMFYYYFWNKRLIPSYSCKLRHLLEIDISTSKAHLHIDRNTYCLYVYVLSVQAK